jgi:hypothetical protein
MGDEEDAICGKEFIPILFSLKIILGSVGE